MTQISQFVQVMLHLDGRHAAGSGRGYSLPPLFVLAVAAGKDARNIRLGGVRLRDDVPLLVHINCALDDVRVWYVSDCKEKAVALYEALLVLFEVLHAKVCELLPIAEGLRGDVLVEELDLLVRPRSGLHGFGCPENISANDEVYLGAILGQKQSFLHRRIPSSDHGQWPVSEKWGRSVTHSTGADPLLPIFTVSSAGYVHSLRSGTSGNNDGPCANSLPPFALADERKGGEVNLVDSLGDDSCSHFQGLHAKSVGDFAPADALWEARKIFHIRRRCQLSASCDTSGEKTFKHQRFQLSASSVYRGSVSCWTAANNEHVLHLILLFYRRHLRLS
mmetsp:Transcript_3975/g.11917  ORF Transcript_3975/g.11917 Transcript_3975/m.11917 type:complete len:334 (-) Transcript_3975:59-1060(-)